MTTKLACATGVIEALLADTRGEKKGKISLPSRVSRVAFETPKSACCAGYDQALQRLVIVPRTDDQQHETPLYSCHGVFIDRFIFRSNWNPWNETPVGVP